MFSKAAHALGWSVSQTKIGLEARDADDLALQLAGSSTKFDARTLIVATLDEVMLTHENDLWTDAGMDYVYPLVRNRFDTLQADVFGSAETRVRPCGGLSELIQGAAVDGTSVIYITGRDPVTDHGSRVQLGKIGIDGQGAVILYRPADGGGKGRTLVNYIRSLDGRGPRTVIVIDHRSRNLSSYIDVSDTLEKLGVTKLITVHYTAEADRQRSINADCKRMDRLARKGVNEWLSQRKA
jgi:hypothetical protein